MIVDAHIHVGGLSRSEQELGSKEWLADYGASHHLYKDYESSSEVSWMQQVATVRKVHGIVSVHEWGKIIPSSKGEGNSVSIITLEDVLFVPQLGVNLFSVQKIRQANFIPVYNKEHGTIIVKEQVVEGATRRLVQFSTMTKIKLMGPTLDCSVVMRDSLPSSLSRMDGALRAQLSMSLLHRRLDHYGCLGEVDSGEDGGWDGKCGEGRSRSLCPMQAREDDSAPSPCRRT